MEEKGQQEKEEAKLPGIAAAIFEADAVLVLTGAGMGVFFFFFFFNSSN